MHLLRFLLIRVKNFAALDTRRELRIFLQKLAAPFLSHPVIQIDEAIS